MTKSRELVQNNERFSKPLYSEDRYLDEINRYRTTRNIEVPVVEKTTFHKHQ